jgi:carboxylesterase
MRRVTSSVLPGAEPMSRQGGSVGVLVLHGFTGNPQSLRPLAEVIAAAGFSVELPLLPGHGTAVEDMVPTRFGDWSATAEQAYLALAERTTAIGVVGLSMGGALALWLAERHPEIKALVLVNPMADPPADSFRDVMRGLLDAGIEVAPGVGSDIAKEGMVELAYPGSPVAAALSLFEGVDVVHEHLGEVHCPVLLFSSREDHVVPSASGDVVAAEVAGPLERIWLERSYHVATLDHDAPDIEVRTLAFLTGILGDPSADSRARWLTASGSRAAASATAKGVSAAAHGLGPVEAGSSEIG